MYVRTLCVCMYTKCIPSVIAVYMVHYVHIYVAVPRHNSMSPARVNAVLSGYCNRFVRQTTWQDCIG